MKRLLTIFLVLLLTVPVFAVNKYVKTNGSNGLSGNDTTNAYLTITFAFSNIGNGDTIFVMPGWYNESVTVPDADGFTLINYYYGQVGHDYDVIMARGINPTSWTSVGGGMYFNGDVSGSAVVQTSGVFADTLPTPMNLVADSATCRSTVNSYYHNTATDRLFIHLTNGTDPTNHKIEVATGTGQILYSTNRNYGGKYVRVKGITLTLCNANTAIELNGGAAINAPDSLLLDICLRNNWGTRASLGSGLYVYYATGTTGTAKYFRLRGYIWGNKNRGTGQVALTYFPGVTDIRQCFIGKNTTTGYTDCIQIYSALDPYVNCAVYLDSCVAWGNSNWIGHSFINIVSEVKVIRWGQWVANSYGVDAVFALAQESSYVYGNNFLGDSCYAWGSPNGISATLSSTHPCGTPCDGGYAALVVDSNNFIDCFAPNASTSTHGITIAGSNQSINHIYFENNKILDCPQGYALNLGDTAYYHILAQSGNKIYNVASQNWYFTSSGGNPAWSPYVLATGPAYDTTADDTTLFTMANEKALNASYNAITTGSFLQLKEIRDLYFGDIPPTAPTINLFRCYSRDYSGENDIERMIVTHPLNQSADSIIVATGTTAYPNRNSAWRVAVPYLSGRVDTLYDTVLVSEPTTLYMSAWLKSGSTYSHSVTTSRTWKQLRVINSNATYRVTTGNDSLELCGNLYPTDTAIWITSANVIIRGQGDTLFLFNGSAHGTPGIIYANNYITIESLTVIQNASTDTSCIGVQFSTGHDNKLLYSNVHMKGRNCGEVKHPSGAGLYNIEIKGGNYTSYVNEYRSRSSLSTSVIDFLEGRSNDSINGLLPGNWNFWVHQITIDSCPHWGICVAGRSIIDSNTIAVNAHNNLWSYPSDSTWQSADNSFAINLSQSGENKSELRSLRGSKIRGNIITMIQSSQSEGGRGIAVGGSGAIDDRIEVSGNSVIISNGRSDYNPEGTARGIKLEGRLGYINLFNNYVEVKADTSDTTTYIGENAVGIQVSAYPSGGLTSDTCLGYIYVYNNTIVGMQDNITTPIQGLCDVAALSVVKFDYVDSVCSWNNHIMSNVIPLWSSIDDANQYNPCMLVNFISEGDTFNWVGTHYRNAQGDSGVVVLSSYDDQTDNIIRNPYFINSSPLKYRIYGEAGSEIFTQRSLNIFVCNVSLVPLSAVICTVTNAYILSGHNLISFIDTTDATGYIRGNVTYKYDGWTGTVDADSNAFNPITASFKKVNYENNSVQYTLTDSLAQRGGAVQDTVIMVATDEEPPATLYLRGLHK